MKNGTCHGDDCANEAEFFLPHGGVRMCSTCAAMFGGIFGANVTLQPYPVTAARVLDAVENILGRQGVIAHGFTHGGVSNSEPPGWIESHTLNPEVKVRITGQEFADLGVRGALVELERRVLAAEGRNPDGSFVETPRPAAEPLPKVTRTAENEIDPARKVTPRVVPLRGAGPEVLMEPCRCPYRPELLETWIPGPPAGWTCRTCGGFIPRSRAMPRSGEAPE